MVQHYLVFDSYDNGIYIEREMVQGYLVFNSQDSGIYIYIYIYIYIERERERERERDGATLPSVKFSRQWYIDGAKLPGVHGSVCNFALSRLLCC